MKDVLLGMVLGAGIGVMACSCPAVKKMVSNAKNKVSSVSKDCCCNDDCVPVDNSPKTEEWQ